MSEASRRGQEIGFTLLFFLIASLFCSAVIVVEIEDAEARLRSQIRARCGD